jgi:hypothetical protein
MAINIQQSIITELSDFIVSQPSLETLAAYQIPSNIQQHLDYLLERHREKQLAAEEAEELEKILLLNDLMALVKAKAKLKLAGKA